MARSSVSSHASTGSHRASFDIDSARSATSEPSTWSAVRAAIFSTTTSESVAPLAALGSAEEDRPVEEAVSWEHTKRGRVGAFVEHLCFRYFIAAVIVTDMSIFIYSLSVTQPPPWEFPLTISILSLYSLEVLLKLYAFRLYFLTEWINVLDFTIVVVSVVLALTNSSFYRLLLPARALRILRPVARVVRLLRVVGKTYQQGSQYFAKPSLRAKQLAHLTELPSNQLVTVLKRLRFNMSLSPMERKEVAVLIKLLASNRLYRPNYGDLDPEFAAWLTVTGLNEVDESRRQLSSVGPGVPHHRASAASRSDLHLHSDSMEVLTESPLAAVDGGRLEEALDDAALWSWSVFELNDASGGVPLASLSYALFRDPRYDLITIYQIEKERLFRFLKAVEAWYYPNEYHNRLHAADVTQATHYFLMSCNFADQLSDREVMALLLSAIVHDVRHPGRTNAFLIATEHELAIRYNDTNVLENFHLFSAYTLLRQERTNIFHAIGKSERAKLRALIIALVLATDMKEHFALLGDFNNKVSTGYTADDSEYRLAAMKICLKCADIAHPTRPEALHRRWSDHIMEEFFQQGDEERKLHLPVSPLCDRGTVQAAKSQSGFIKFIVAPVYNSWVNFLGGAAAQTCIRNLLDNADMWEVEALRHRDAIAAGLRQRSSSSFTPTSLSSVAIPKRPLSMAGSSRSLSLTSSRDLEEKMEGRGLAEPLLVSSAV